MRPLNQYFIVGKELTNVASTLGSPKVFTVPVDGRIVGVMMNPRFTNDLETTFDIVVNTVDSGVVAVLPLAALLDVGVLMELRAAQSVEVKAGDAIKLNSNQETTANGSVDFTWIMERNNRGSDSEFYIRSEEYSGIEGAGNSTRVVSPWAGRVSGMAINVHTLIGTVAPPAPHTFDIIKANAGQDMDFALPDATPDESGLLMEMIFNAGGDQVHFVAGEGMWLTTNGEQVAACDVDLTWIFERAGEGNLGGRDLREYSLEGDTILLSTGGALSDGVVIPESGELVGVALSGSVAINAETNLKVRVNTDALANDIFLLPNAGHAAHGGIVLPAKEKVHLTAGDLLELRSGGEQIAVATDRITWIIRR